MNVEQRLREAEGLLTQEEKTTIENAFRLPEQYAMNAPGYSSLADVLLAAYKQASVGKGRERHGNDLPFDEQPMQQEADACGIGFIAGQVRKKMREALGLSAAHAEREILGVINYAAGAIVWMRRNPGKWPGDHKYDSK